MAFRCLLFLSLFILEALARAGSTTLPRRSGKTMTGLARRYFAIEGAYINPVTMANDGQSYYMVIQTGEINFRLALDTASSDTWITSSSCSTSQCNAVPRYPVAYQNPTFESVNGNTSEFKASYADGTAVSGFVAKETFHFSNLTVPEHVFGLVTESNVTMVDDISGIIGLGFPRISTINGTATNSTPLFPGLAQRGQLSYPLFGLHLTRNNTGSLTFGAVDSSVVTDVNKISWNEVVEFPPIGNENNVSSYYQWAVPLEAISVNAKTVLLSPSYPDITQDTSIAMFDVGTSGIYGPWADVSKIFASINGARLVDSNGQWAVPCSTDSQLTFTIGQQNFTLLPSDYLIGPASGNPEICLAWPRAVTPSADAIDWQLGSPFLRTVYSIFSLGINEEEPPMVGLYPLQRNSSGSATSISSFLSSVSATIETTLPNSLLATPSITPPPYGLNSSISAPTGGIVSTGLANRTYSPIFGADTTNLSAIPLITPSPTIAVFTTTNSAGLVSTSTSTQAIGSVVLGVPPGWMNSASATLHVPMITLLVPIIFYLMKDLA